ncbi:hypothetical protein [Chitinilyticum aquatile]|uniref:hypothetical protein n=1 Tax=Chitinilyticum aquatile TaxID=362520 RepID=UPI0012DC7968|nr:hypothetical protein [Chitinilyticum aquatile]
MRWTSTGWTIQAQWITRETLSDINSGYFLLPHPTLFFKNWQGQFATAAVTQLQAGNLVLTVAGGRQITYDSVENLLADGWVID